MTTKIEPGKAVLIFKTEGVTNVIEIELGRSSDAKLATLEAWLNTVTFSIGLDMDMLVNQLTADGG